MNWIQGEEIFGLVLTFLTDPFKEDDEIQPKAKDMQIEDLEEQFSVMEDKLKLMGRKIIERTYRNQALMEQNRINKNNMIDLQYCKSTHVLKIEKEGLQKRYDEVISNLHNLKKVPFQRKLWVLGNIFSW